MSIEISNDDHGNEFSLEFSFGTIEGSAVSTYGSDYVGNFDLTKEQTKDLYLAMKRYYEEEEE